MVTNTQNPTISFSEIINYANNKPEYFSVEKYNSQQVILLTFTLHGDYIGSTIEKANYYTALERLLKNYEPIDPNDDQQHGRYYSKTNGCMRYETGYSTKAIAIVNDLPGKDWETILAMVESLEDYPILDDIDYSEQQSDDCYESWQSWQFAEIKSELEKYSINLDDQKFDQIVEREETDLCNWLWCLITSDKIDSNIDTLEVNATSYYNFDTEDQEFMERLAFIIKQSANY